MPELEEVITADYTFRIPITKAGDKENSVFMEVTLKEVMEDFPDISIKKLIGDGLKVHLNSRMSKITGTRDEAAKTAASEIAEQNLANLREGKVNVAAAKEAKMPQAVKVEAMRLAKAVVKQAIKEKGEVKVSHVPAKDITAAAKMLLEGDKGPRLYKMAEDNISAREEAEKALKIDVSGIKEDAKLKAKAEKASAERKATTAAKKAGKTVATRAKPKGGAAQATAH